MGKTSSGLPVMVNKQVAAADVVVGIGGVYPSRKAGFGGGSKLALGVLGYRSIMGLHCDRPQLRWGANGVASAVRQDLDDIARIIGLRTVINLHLDGDRNVVRLACGDHFQFYADEVAFARQAFMAPPPRDADVVIANAYPNDLSLTFARKKGLLLSPCARRGCRALASRPAVKDSVSTDCSPTSTLLEQYVTSSAASGVALLLFPASCFFFQSPMAD